jgi:hypothetical protein
MKISVSWDITPCCPLKVHYVLEERVSIFRVEFSAKEAVSRSLESSVAFYATWK